MPQGIIYIDTTTAEMKYQGTSSTPGILCDATGSVPLVPCQTIFPLTNGVQSVNGPSGSTFASLGTRTFDPSTLFSGNSKITRTFTFKALVQTTPGVTMQIVLYNTSDGLQVAPTLLSSSSSSLVELSASLTIVTDLPNALKTYDVEIRISSPGVPALSDMAICKSAEISVRYS